MNLMNSQQFIEAFHTKILLLNVYPTKPTVYSS